ncbi:MAG TPA: hypothetical protein DCS04_04625, partial [Ruminococcaceae bacterium]|nr:hypothetical protein [Oscillospiraceae bacterium]
TEKLTARDRYFISTDPRSAKTVKINEKANVRAICKPSLPVKHIPTYALNSIKATLKSDLKITSK